MHCRSPSNWQARNCFTFEPHPRTFFRPQTPVFRITPPHLKSDLLLAIGFDAVISETFDDALASQEAEEFIERHLVAESEGVPCSDRFQFPFRQEQARRIPQLLVEEGKKHGFEVTSVERYVDDGGERMSSSRIAMPSKTAISSVQTFCSAATGGCGAMCRKGQQLGRTLGYPTANIKLHPATTLRHGIYAVRLTVPMAVSMTASPASAEGRHLTMVRRCLRPLCFDFSDDLYDEFIAVELIGWIRPEEKFDSVEALVEPDGQGQPRSKRNSGAARP